MRTGGAGPGPNRRDLGARGRGARTRTRATRCGRAGRRRWPPWSGRVGRRAGRASGGSVSTGRAACDGACGQNRYYRTLSGGAKAGRAAPLRASLACSAAAASIEATSGSARAERTTTSPPGRRNPKPAASNAIGRAAGPGRPRRGGNRPRPVPPVRPGVGAPDLTQPVGDRLGDPAAVDRLLNLRRQVREGQGFRHGPLADVQAGGVLPLRKWWPLNSPYHPSCNGSFRRLSDSFIIG